jgi:hypothetical protein
VRRFIFGVLIGLSLAGAAAVAQAPAGPGVDYPPILVQDSGANQGRAAHAVNCTGTGVACTVTAGVWTLDVSSIGGANVVEKSVVLTSLQPNPAPATVTGAAWVTSSSVIVCSVLGTTADGLTPEAINAAGLTVTVENRVAGVGFDVRLMNWYGLEGTVRVHCIGA